MEYGDFNWEIERDIKMLIEFANNKFGKDREWTIEIIYWRDKDRMIELISGRDEEMMLDIIRYHNGKIKYLTKEAKSKIEFVNLISVQ